ncbi:uncharacterized protein LOC134534187 [Bacillus rossius redtenbacheri]|uniref:uncharacterized protein LOC134534187 n=1 Tax=Bacillus rossius redtenbacheri TaxID=93214 RepID=UPI002FDE351C
MAHQVLPLLVGLLVTYCYRLPPVIAIPDKKEAYGDDDWPLRRSYRLEDFLWTGSGDGPTSSPCVTATAVQGAPAPSSDWGPELIRPTPTLAAPASTPTWPPGPPPQLAPDPRYWLLTVLADDSRPAPGVAELENRLARLYRVAFTRQQERHLGIANATVQALQRLRRARVPEPVTVQLHNRSAPEAGGMSLLYTVRVAGRPVLARAAAADMRLVSAGEMAAELGRPVVTKAEPYLKQLPPLDGSWRRARARDTWLLLGSAAAALLLLLLLAVFLALSLGKKKRGKRRVLASAGRPRGASNAAYRDDEGAPEVADVPAGGTPRFRDEAVVVGAVQRKSSASGSESSDTSLVRRRPAHAPQGAFAPRAPDPGRVAPKPQPRKRLSAARRAQQLPQDGRKRSQSPPPTQPRGSQQATCEEPLVPTTGIAAASPNSFLSMPSIKAFPRGANIPKPLVCVLEPVSVRHLDAEEGVVLESVRKLARHGSLEGEDPGVIGPVVWDMHCHRVQCRQPAAEPIIEDLVLDVEGAAEEECGAEAAMPSVGRVRQRFQELLDDAFSLFGGSRSDSPVDEEGGGTSPALQRVRSAVVRPEGEPLPGSRDCAPRPHTSSHRRPATASAYRPRGAWGTAQPSPDTGRPGTPPRPLSAGPFHRPAVDPALVLSDERLPPTDPAVPLIAAIKEELRRFQGSAPLPGSTSAET